MPLNPFKLNNFNFNPYFFPLCAFSHTFALAPRVFVDPLRVARPEIQF